MSKNWTPIDINLESNWIWTFLFLYSIIYLAVDTKLKIKWDMWCKIENLIETKCFTEICILFFTRNEFLNITPLTYFICFTPWHVLFYFIIMVNTLAYHWSIANVPI